MGIPATKLVYDFRRKFNSVNSGRNQDIALVDIVAYLNEGQELWFENRVMVAQTNQKVRNDLRAFKKDGIDIGCSGGGENCEGIYPKDLYHRLNHRVTASKDCCQGFVKTIIPRIVQSDDQDDAGINPWRNADFFFEQLFAVETDRGLRIFHQNEMVIDSLKIDYYRKPKEIHAPSLEECEGDVYYNYRGTVITRDQDFEVDATYAANDVVNIAILLATRDVSDVQGFQTQLNLILGNQNLHKNNIT